MTEIQTLLDRIKTLEESAKTWKNGAPPKGILIVAAWKADFGKVYIEGGKSDDFGPVDWWMEIPPLPTPTVR